MKQKFLNDCAEVQKTLTLPKGYVEAGYKPAQAKTEISLRLGQLKADVEKGVRAQRTLFFKTPSKTLVVDVDGKRYSCPLALSEQIVRSAYGDRKEEERRKKPFLRDIIDFTLSQRTLEDLLMMWYPLPQPSDDSPRYTPVEGDVPSSQLVTVHDVPFK